MRIQAVAPRVRSDLSAAKKLSFILIHYQLSYLTYINMKLLNATINVPNKVLEVKILFVDVTSRSWHYDNISIKKKEKVLRIYSFVGSALIWLKIVLFVDVTSRSWDCDNISIKEKEKVFRIYSFIGSALIWLKIVKTLPINL